MKVLGILQFKKKKKEESGQCCGKKGGGGEGEKKVTWCFMSSQPVWLYVKK